MMIDDLERLMSILDELNKITFINVEDIKEIVKRKIRENRDKI